MHTFAVGFMSGTSCDGVDVAVLDTDGKLNVTALSGLTLPYEEDLSSRLMEASQQEVPLSSLLRLEKELSNHHVAALRLLLEKQPELRSEVAVLGFHGHTVRHIPDEQLTMQIGNPWILAKAFGIPVVTDFRRCDVAAGGQGAPLVPLFHQTLFAKETQPVLVLNLGGVANVTWLGQHEHIIAGDTGPGCGLLDKWAQEMANLPYDRDGILASAGQVDSDILVSALSRNYFSRPLPKSADRYDFDFVDVSRLSVEDGAATLCAVTAESVYRAVQNLPAMPKQVWVTGGGVHHPVIMSMLRERFKDVRNISERGLNPDFLEAECFAWLAVRHLENLPLTIPATTGCEKSVSGGVTVRFQ
ncbi:anhydro-N-acetylmuramic acid kinase [Bythopirellula polymerisocia]|uniref:Anhydro-N-acetylmuramic acid kinase n=1 Tax=Bythopirellula polymerisocia TaxID=2528003 RepID=A0A5C6CK25_9BACT|nr:anhydro-N-acetylmuramic acid kinase [Bythopirellula polymerisocia]TWU23651.1 Anhydro-N-acetylmuramic acid kinase [Bythopirellula polymerisocia]